MARLTANGIQFDLADANNSINSYYWMYPAGTQKMFWEASAPTGWTKDTGSNNRALRVVTGSSGGSNGGGTRSFTALFTNTRDTGGRALSVANLPSHRHWVSRAPIDDNNNSQWSTNTQEFGLYSDAGTYSASDQNRSVGRNTAYTGSGTTHDHDMDLRVQYVDVIICQRD